jgi:hypothetical protein
MHEYSVDSLKGLLQKAIDTFIERDKELLVLGVSERCLAHRLAIYLQELFPALNVDCEYNRDGPNLKELKPPAEPLYWDDDEAKSVFPDIIVHRRNTSDSNLLVVEIKKIAKGGLANFDRDKLVAFTGEHFHYSLGAFVVFTTGDSAKVGSVEWFHRHH